MELCTAEELSVASDGLLMVWLCLSASPSGSPVDTSLLTTPPQVIFMVHTINILCLWYI